MIEFIIGVFVGVILYYATYCIFKKKQKVSGTFVIDTVNPEKDVCTFEFAESLNDIYAKKQIVLDIKVIEENSRG